MNKNTKTNPSSNTSPALLVTRQPAVSRDSEPAARLAAAQHLLATGQHARAEQLLTAALGNPALQAEAHYLLGIGALMRNDNDAALRHARAAVRGRPAEPRFQFALGRCLKAAGDLQDAAGAYRRAIELQPGYADAHVSLGIVLKSLGDVDAAIACYEAAIALNPQLAVAHANLAAARALLSARDPQAPVDGLPRTQDIEGIRRAVALDPQDPKLHRNLGLILQRAGDNDEAAQCMNRALTLDPSDLEACLCFGECLMALGAHDLARQGYEKWLQLNPKNARVMRVLAGALVRTGEADAGLDWARQALAIEPDAGALMEEGNALIQLRRLEEGLAVCRQAIDQSGRNPALYPVLLLGMNYLHDDPATIFAAHAEFGAAVPRPPPKPASRVNPRVRVAGDKLRVGYVSGDFMRHSVAFFISPLLEFHDTTRFEVVCYHNNPRSDHVTARLKSYGHRWVDCAHLTDDALARQITADGIDVLIDLAGLTALSRALMFALAPAPVQIAYLGYPTVTGVPSIDFRITDHVIDPGDMPPLASEQPLHLPGTMFCYRPDETAPPLASPPSERRGFVTFGSFNNAAKISNHTLRLWAQVLSAVPGSRLLLKAATMAQPTLRQNIEKAFAAHGIACDRLTLQARSADDLSHLALYNEIDIGLDTFPYNGATTTCEALWMGLPVITRRGRSHTSRMGASLLNAIGKPQWVADTDVEFVTRATALAHDRTALSTWRAASRSAISTSPLLDHTGFTRNFEALLLRAWAISSAATRHSE